MTEQLPAESKTFSLVPASFEEAQKIASLLAGSDLVPKDYKGKPANVMVAMAWGGELGLKPLQSIQNVAVINGRPAIWGDAALAVCMARADFEDIIEEIQGEGDARVAVCTVKRKGRSPVTRRFSVDDAKRAGLWDDRPKVKRWKDGNQIDASNDSPWFRYQPRMLQMRARGFALRDCFPDAMRGFHLAEELQDGQEEIDVTPSRPAVVMPTSTAKPAAAEPVKTETVDKETGEILAGNDAPAQADAFSDQGAAAPAASMEGQPTASEGQLRVMRSKLTGAGLAEQQLADAFGVPTIAAIPAPRVNEALAWIKNGGQK